MPRPSLLIPAVCTAMLASPVMAPASAQDDLCGAVITTDLILDHDLACEGSDGLVAGASDITIDLNGHQVVTVGRQSVAAVRVSGFVNVTVRGGVAEARFDPYSGTGGSGIVVERGADGATVVNVSTGYSGSGARISDSDGVRATGSQFSAEGRGLWVLNSVDSVFTDNRVRSADSDGASFDSVSRTVLDSNHFTGFGQTFRLTGSGNQVRGNTFKSQQGSSQVEGDRNIIKRNSIEGATGLQVMGSMNVVSANRAENLIDGGGLQVSGSQNVVADNAVIATHGDGIRIADARATVSGNVARNNLGLGLYASQRVKGAGNRASGNGDARQCVNVSCMLG